MKKGDFLFVYGTLRPGESASLMGRAGVDYLGKDMICGSIFDLGWYPGVKLDGGGMVTGDVFVITDDAIVSELDSYEGYPSLYGRSQVPTMSGSGVVWIYTYNHTVKSDQRIESGDWQARETRKVA